MKKNFKLLMLAVFVAAASCSFTTKSFEDPDKDKLLVDLITYVLERGHYDAKSLDDDFSIAVYEDFIDNVDPIKRYFLASDIEEFEQYKTSIDDQLLAKELDFFNLVYSRLDQRIQEAQTYYPEILDSPFDFEKEEEINVDYDNMPYADSKKALKDRWRKQLKYTTLSTYYDNIEDNLFKVENEEDYTPKSKAQLEADARETTLNSFNDNYSFVNDLERKDYFAVFLNSVVMQFDPHTNYFAPPDRDRFDLQMSGRLEGIGARLQKQNDYIKVVEIINGGPAWRGEHIKAGDIIMKVKQEDEEDPVSIVGMRVDDAVKLIKGPKGTKVTLTIKRVDGTIEEETITRDVVEIGETYAKSALIQKEDRKFGLINLPAFYFTMEDYEERNAAADVKKQIIALKEQGVEGLVLDLRNNGGGSLRTAVDIAGLFIKDGPVVQVASNGKRKEVLSDRDSEVVWDGPLVILVNDASASASEILAAAMQDYKRAVIIGSKQTYGKGTVQNLLDLNQWLRNNDMGDMGALKLTTQKYYRVNGGSTQLEGVKSDVVMPGRYAYLDIGEKEYDNPLPYDKITPADYTPYDGYIDYEATIKRSNERMAKSAELKLIDENAKWIKQRQDENVVSLNLNAYTQAIKDREEYAKRFDVLEDYESGLDYTSLPAELALIEKDTTLGENRKRWHKNLRSDIYVEEAVSVLEDLKLNNIRQGSFAKIKD
ncbi:carboxy terminal-processing peptidase [Gilvibacter sediminis]|uniref:carboxy terminal-processing peptidase n=1 Tax=Gilvibacter sediminis TaxID=379071 RepID=UPI002350BDAB|nr:carboxy terminal-processing peptidase [Gilvibacter sediminis]MDC7997398.1 carboxy terminal-processing peptidase [Gilvibacter sediminis]